MLWIIPFITKQTMVPSEPLIGKTMNNNLNAEISKRISEKTHSYVTPRLKIKFWLIPTKDYLTAVPGNTLMQVPTNTNLVSKDQIAMLQHVISYWGIEMSQYLQKHLIEPCQPYTKIIGCNDDGWVTSEDPEMLYYVSGIDFYECHCKDGYDEENGHQICGKKASHMSWTKVPTRLLLDYILDCQEAHNYFKSHKLYLPADFQAERVTELGNDYVWGKWQKLGDYKECIEYGREYEITEDTFGGGQGIGLNREPVCSILSYPKCIQLLDLNGGSLWGSDTKKTVLTIPRSALNAHVKTLEVWPDDLPAEALFYLFLDKLIELRPKEFVKYLKIPDVRDDLPRYDRWENEKLFKNL